MIRRCYCVLAAIACLFSLCTGLLAAQTKDGAKAGSNAKQFFDKIPLNTPYQEAIYNLGEPGLRYYQDFSRYVWKYPDGSSLTVEFKDKRLSSVMPEPAKGAKNSGHAGAEAAKLQIREMTAAKVLSILGEKSGTRTRQTVRYVCIWKFSDGSVLALEFEGGKVAERYHAG